MLPPDVNSSDHGFVVSGKSIRFGLDAVKNVGHSAVEAIIAARERGGPFASIWDFCERVDARAVNKRAIECLVKCGALDSTGDSRRGMLEVLAQAQASGSKSQEDARRGQGSIFDLGDTGRGRDAGPAGGVGSPATCRSRPRSSTSASCCGSRRRRSAPSSPPTRWARCATRSARGWTAPRRGDAAGRTAPGSPWAGSSARRSGCAPAAAAYVMFATLDDLEGRVELFVRDAASEAADADRARSRGPGAGPGRPQGPRRDEPRGRRGRALRARARTSWRRRGRRRRPAATRADPPAGQRRRVRARRSSTS